MLSVPLASVLVITRLSSAVSQVPTVEGNRSDFHDWQPTQGEINSRERAAGVQVPASQQQATDQELLNLGNKLIEQDRQLGVARAPPLLLPPPSTP
jgi:hypothetical protein